jgi:hypothetical protein
MKARVFNKVSSGVLSPKDKTPCLSINPRAGLISFSSGFCEKVKLNADSHRINFIQDEENEKNWFVQITKDEQAFALRQSEKGVTFNSVHISREVLRSIDLEGGGSVRILLATEPEKDKEFGAIYTLITKSAKPLAIKSKKA